MANTFKVKFKHAYTSNKHGELTQVGEIIEVISNSSKPNERDVVEALKKKLGVSELGLGSSVTMWEVVQVTNKLTQHFTLKFRYKKELQ